MRKTILTLVCVVALGALVANAALTPEQQAREEEKAQDVSGHFTGQLESPKVVGTARADAGTLQYDTGVFTNLPQYPPVAVNFSFGNRYHTNEGNPIPLPITITSLSFYMALVDGSSTATAGAWMTIFGPLNTAQTAATSALESINMAGIQAGIFQNQVVSPAIALTGTGNGSFLVGAWAGGDVGSTTAVVTCAGDCVGFDSNGTVFNGMAIQDVNGADYNSIPTANAMIRVSGNVVPVELMSFSIE